MRVSILPCIEIIRREIKSCGKSVFLIEDKSMKRTRAAIEIQQQCTIEKDQNNEKPVTSLQTTSKVCIIFTVFKR